MTTWDKLKQNEERKERRIKKIASWIVGTILFLSFIALIWSMIR